MDSNYQQLGEDDVLQISVGTSKNGTPRLMDTVALFTNSLKEALGGWPYVGFVMSSTGYPISILKASGGGWQKGNLRVRIVVEFEPEPKPVDSDFDGAWPPQDPIS